MLSPGPLPIPALRCAIATVNVPTSHIRELEKWMWTKHKIRIPGGEPYKIRLSTPYYLRRADMDRFLEKFDEYRKEKERKEKKRKEKKRKSTPDAGMVI